MPRPSKLTSALSEAFCEALSSGASLAEACARVGIGESTALEWLARGRGSHSSRRASRRYSGFAYAVDAAFAEFAEPAFSDAVGVKTRAREDEGRADEAAPSTPGRTAPFVHVSQRARADEGISALQDYDF